MTIDMVSCQGLGGFMELGFVEQGFELQHRTGTLEFGNNMVNNNRHLLGDKWDFMFSDHPERWYVPQGAIPVVVGLPPCSGWSVWSGPSNRGPDAKAHAHTRAFMKYVGRVKPEVAVFECVTQAYSQGRSVMLQYRDMIEEISGQRYTLHHVKMNNAMIGGCSYRPRYFWVAVRRGIRFAPRAEWPTKLPTIMEMLGDLEDLPESWDPQPYRSSHEPWVCHQISRDGLVDGHVGHHNIHAQRIRDVIYWLKNANTDWHWGEGLSSALERIYKLYNKLPPSWESKAAKIIERRFDMGFSLPYRWPGDAWANVLTGGCLDMVVHPTQDRCITHREAARLQGLPDSWRIAPSWNYSGLSDTWGKAVTKNSGLWISRYVKDAIEGNVSEYDELASGVPIGDHEWMHETDKGFSRQRARQRYFPATRGGITKVHVPEFWPQPAQAIHQESTLQEIETEEEVELAVA